MKELSNSLKEFYLSYSEYIDPKEAHTLFKDFPNQPNEIALQLQLFIRHHLPKTIHQRNNNSKELWTVSSLLNPMVEKESLQSPLTNQQCGAILLSILKAKQYPCRLRCHFLNEGNREKSKYIGEWLCEVYDYYRNKWFLIDPTCRMPILTNGVSKTSSEMYLTLLGEKSLAQQVSYRYWKGLLAVKQALFDDINSIMGKELLQEEWIISALENKPTLYRKSIENLSLEEQEIVYRLAIMMLAPDDNFELIEDMYKNYILTYSKKS